MNPWQLCARPSPLLLALAGLLAGPPSSQARTLKGELLGRYETGVAFKGAAEIVAYDEQTKRLWVVDGSVTGLDVLDASNPRELKLWKTVSLEAHGGGVNSVDVMNGVVAAVVEAKDAQANGTLVVLDGQGVVTGTHEVGPMPDAVALAHEGRCAIVANEGEPTDDHSNDPEGSVSIVFLPEGVVKHVSFAGVEAPPGIHRAAPAGTSLAQEIEPEYVAVSADGSRAFVTLQETNAIAVIDLAAAKVERVFGMGTKDLGRHAFDGSDKDGKVAMATAPVRALYQPDAIAAFEHGGQTYLLTADEGDPRDRQGYSEETRLAKMKLDAKAFPDGGQLQQPERLGRLKVSSAAGDADGDGVHDKIVAFGGRGMSMWTPEGEKIWESGSEVEERIAATDEKLFGSQGTWSSFDSRSDDKGPEPEGVTVGVVDGARYAFLGLERAGGVMVWDVSEPTSPRWITWLRSSRPEGDTGKGTAGDQSPEGLLFLDEAKSPTGKPLLVVAHEVSGSTAVWELSHGD